MDLSSVNDLIGQGHYDKALQKLSNFSYKDPEVTTLKCLVLREMGNYAQSLKIINEFLEEGLVKPPCIPAESTRNAFVAVPSKRLSARSLPSF